MKAFRWCKNNYPNEYQVGFGVTSACASLQTPTFSQGCAGSCTLSAYMDTDLHLILYNHPKKVGVIHATPCAPPTRGTMPSMTQS